MSAKQNDKASAAQTRLKRNKFTTKKVAKTIQDHPQMARKMQPSLDAMRRGASRRAGKVATNLSQYATQLVLPGYTAAPRVLPNSAPSQVCARVYRRVVDVSQATSNHLRVVMLPDLFNPGYVSTNNLVSIPTAAPGPLSLTGVIQTTTDSPAAAVNFPASVFKAFAADTNSVIPTSSAGHYGDFNSADGYGRGFPANIPSGSVVSAVFKNASNTKVTAKVSLYVQYNNAGAETTTRVSQLAVGENESASVNYVVPPTTDNRLISIFWVVGNSSKEITLKVEFGFTSAQVTSGAGVPFSPAFSRQIIDNRVSHGRVTAMSLYCQCTTAPLNATGNINCGRVPYTFNPLADMSAQLSALPKNRAYQGKFQDGAFVTWLPSQLEECEVNEVPEMSRILDTAEFIALEIPNWIAGATARLEFVWSVEFYTPNQNFDKILTPPRTPEWNALYYALLSLDAAHCNPEHEETIKDYIRKVTQGIAKAVSWWNEHSETLIAAGEAIAVGAGMLL